MEKVAVDYFKEIDLPEEKGKSIKVTLDELIEKELIVSVNKDGKNVCDTNKSYSKITREKKNYIVETTLICGKEKNTITKKFDFKDCKNCNQTEKDNEKENVTNNESNNNENNVVNNNENNTVQNTVTYYEHVKETTVYSDWGRGNITGDNVENRYEYYEIAKDTYYSVGYITKNQLEDKQVSYTLKLDKVPNKKYYFTVVEESDYIDKTDEKYYLDEEKISLDNIDEYTDIESIYNYSLKEDNFTYELSPYYRNGAFYVDVTVTITNTDNVKSVYDTKLKRDIYLIPIKFNVKFASNKVTADKPNTDYDTITYYRYVAVQRNTIWSTESYVEGYTKTGNTKQG